MSRRFTPYAGIRHDLNIAIVVFCLLIVIDSFIDISGSKLIAQIVSKCEEEYTLLNPDRRCGNREEFQKREFEGFEDKLEQWSKEKMDIGEISHFSIYFRDLENGPWFGVEEDETFSTASLLKVPIMIAFLKEAEKRPELLTQELGYKGEMGIFENMASPDETILPGQYYTGEEVLRRMIVYSDNVSTQLLKSRIETFDPTGDVLTDTYYALGLFAQGTPLSEQMTVKSYASIFRLLYNGSYLNRKMSQKALDLLSQITFKEGLVRGVPSGITIAHKYGIRTYEDTDEKQLHDCGIVYAPDQPFLLCIMTRGKDLKSLSSIIAEIAGKVYNEVISNEEQR